MPSEHLGGQLSGVPRGAGAETTQRLFRLLEQIDALLTSLSNAESA